MSFEQRISLFNDAVSLKESETIPLAPCISSVAQRFYGSCYRDLYYNYEKAGEAAVKFYTDFMPDAYTFSGFISGKSNELAQSSMIDWPGRPGSSVPMHSSHQVIEHEYMTPGEYPELLNDFTGFILHKYIPRAFPGLKGLADISFNPSIILNTSFFRKACSPEAAKAYETLLAIKKSDAEAAAMTSKYQKKIMELGIPPAWTGASEAPLDIIGDYFRGTMGMFEDLMECEEYVTAACDMLADQQIEALSYLKDAQLPVKRVFFPLHKGMDGFMNPVQYENLYWKPLRKIFLALIDIGVTPVAYSEGKYNTRLEFFKDLPKGKVMMHIEDADMAKAKKILGSTLCLSGNLPIYLLEHGTKEQVVDYCKYLIDTCAPGGGYIFDTNGFVENAKQENMEAMFETVRTYGRK